VATLHPCRLRCIGTGERSGALPVPVDACSLSWRRGGHHSDANGARLNDDGAPAAVALRAEHFATASRWSPVLYRREPA